MNCDELQFIQDAMDVDDLLEKLIRRARSESETAEGFTRLRVAKRLNHLARAQQHVQQARESLRGPLIVPRSADHV